MPDRRNNNPRECALPAAKAADEMKATGVTDTVCSDRIAKLMGKEEPEA